MTTDELRQLLMLKLDEAQPVVELYEAYYRGEHRLAFATDKYQDAFGELFSAFATNWCGLVVDVAVERIAIQGFRFGQPEADEEAWGIWQANNLDARSVALHTEAVKIGWGYLLVGPPLEKGGEPRITVEHPSQMTVLIDPATGERIAALKRYSDEQGNGIAVVYEPDRITTFKRDNHAPQQSFLGAPVDDLSSAPEEWRQIDSEENPVGVVIAIPVENNPGVLGGGVSDLMPAVPLNDAANKFFTDMLHASEFAAFPQRVLTGVELPKDPITGEVADETQIRAAVSRLWTFEDPEAKVFDLAAADLGNYVAGIDLAVQHVAAQTRTPPQYLLTKLANISGDALLAAESGLIARVKRKHIDFAEAWEEAMRLAFAWRAIDRTGWVGSDDDFARSLMDDAETIWANPESRNPSVVGDELIKKQQIGVPQEKLWEEAGYTPQEIKVMRKQRAAEDQAKAALEGGGATPQGLAAISQVGDQLEISGLAAKVGGGSQNGNANGATPPPPAGGDQQPQGAPTA